jgi:hypothetical protein
MRGKRGGLNVVFRVPKIAPLFSSLFFGWGERLSVGWKGKGEIQGSLRCGGKCAAFGRDDVAFGAGEQASAPATTTAAMAEIKVRRRQSMEEIV